MAGHSKWANIKHRKGKAELKKGKMIYRVKKESNRAVKQGGHGPHTNPTFPVSLKTDSEDNLTKPMGSVVRSDA